MERGIETTLVAWGLMLVQGPKAAVGRDNTWTGRVPRAEEWCKGNKVGVVREVDLSSL